MQISSYKDYKKGNEEWMPHIPSHWKLTRFQWIGSFESGKAHEPFVDDEGDYICVNSRFISTNGQVIKKCTKNITPAAQGDTLAVMSDLPNGRALARAFYVEQKDVYAVNQRVCRLSPGNEWPRFIYWLIDRNPGLLWFDDGSNQTHIPNSGYQKLSIALPPINEQKYIATFLDHETSKIDALIAKQERLIELLQEKRQAVISHAVTKGLNPHAPMKDSGVEWLGEVPEHWRTSKIKHYFRTASGSTPNSEAQSLYYTDEEDESGTPWIRTTDIDNGEVSNAEIFITEQAIADTACKALPKDTVLVALYGGGGTVGKNGILKIPASVNQALCAILPAKECIPEYLHKYVQFLRPFWMERAVSARKAGNISQELVGDTKFPLPSIHEQEDILNFLNKSLSEIESLSCAADSCLQLLKERRSALISAAVTGQIDVRGLVPGEETA